MKTIVFVDTETTGLDADEHYIWQVAWIEGHQIDNKLKLVSGKEIVIFPRGKKHPKKLKAFTKSLEKADVIVGHNIDFEYSFFSSYGLKIHQETFCTMEESTDICKIPYYGYYGYYGYKWPKLSEAVKILLCEEPNHDKLHDARYDVMLTAKLYAYLRNLGLDTENLNWHHASPFKRFMYGFLYSPIDPYRTIRYEIGSKLFNLRHSLKKENIKISKRKLIMYILLSELERIARERGIILTHRTVNLNAYIDELLDIVSKHMMMTESELIRYILTKELEEIKKEKIKEILPKS